MVTDRGVTRQFPLPSADELKAKLKERDHHIREQWIQLMEARLVREELIKCQRAEGVNAYAVCKDLAERYLTMLPDARVKGWKVVDMR